MPCLVSGYPVLGPRIEFARAGMAASREEWNRLVMVGKMAATAADSGDVQVNSCFSILPFFSGVFRKFQLI